MCTVQYKCFDFGTKNGHGLKLTLCTESSIVHVQVVQDMESMIEFYKMKYNSLKTEYSNLSQNFSKML